MNLKHFSQHFVTMTLHNNRTPSGGTGECRGGATMFSSAYTETRGWSKIHSLRKNEANELWN